MLLRRFSHFYFPVVIMIFVNMLSLAQDVPQLPITSDSLVLPEFKQQINLAAVVAALRSDDSETLLQQAKTLAEAEKSAAKRNKPMPAIVLVGAAIQAAYHKESLEGLAKIETSIASIAGLTADEQQSFKAQIELTRKLMGASRRIDPQTGLKPGEASPESVALHKTFAREIQMTQKFGTEEDLDDLVAAVSQLTELHPKQIDHLVRLAKTSRVAIRERPNQSKSLEMVASLSRSEAAGLRMIGPAEVKPKEPFSIIIVPISKPGSARSKISLQASPGLRVPESVEWNGKPMVIPVAINAQPDSVITIAGGTDTGKLQFSWSGRVRETID